MYNYKITVQYDGARYKGWQKQQNTLWTIQGKLEAVLAELIGNEVEVHGSGRTDAGVHAIEQVANFKCEQMLEPEAVKAYMNHYLPEDIGILLVEEVPLRFHSRLNAIEKQYEYHIWNVAKPDVFRRKYTAYVPEKLDIQKMQEAAELLVGEHDFRSFCSNQKMKKSTVRQLYEIQIQSKQEEIILTFRGNGFLYNMVRIMCGTLIEVGLGKRIPEEMRAILMARDRKMAGRTAQPEGLFLKKVVYPK